jgi:hypothetical protein
MSFNLIPGMLKIGPWFNTVGNPPAAGSALQINAATHKVCIILLAPKDGTLHSFEVMLAAVGQAPANGLKFSFQSISGGEPDNTVDQYRNVTSGITATTWLSPPGPLTDDGTNGGVKRTVTAGEPVGCVIEFISFSASDSVDFAGNNESMFEGSLSCRKSTDSGASYSSVTSQANLRMALKYDDGNYEVVSDNLLPIVSYTNNSLNSGSTPDEWGLRFQLPFNFEIGVIRTPIAFAGSGTLVIRLYTSDDTVVDEVSITEPTIFGPTTNAIGPFIPLNRISPMMANATHRLTIRPPATAWTLREFAVPTNAHLAAVSGGIQIYKTTRTNDGAWTDTDTARPWIQLYISSFEAIAGGTSGSLTFLG